MSVTGLHATDAEVLHDGARGDAGAISDSNHGQALLVEPDHLVDGFGGGWSPTGLDALPFEMD